jgi:hypothetical protein
MISMLPACGTLPGDRLLFVAGLGGMGLLAQLVAAVLEQAAWLPRLPGWRPVARIAVWALLINHLVFAPIMLVQSSSQMKVFGDVIERAGFSLPAGAEVKGKTVFIVNAPSSFLSGYAGLVHFLDGEPTEARVLTLGSGILPTRIRRPAENVLSIHPGLGYLAPRGRPLPGHEDTQPAFDMRYLLPVFDRLYRDATPFREGQLIEIPGVTVEIAAITPDGRPDVVRFHFDRSLDDPSLYWLEWKDGQFIPFEVPAVGQTVTLPAATVPGLS